MEIITITNEELKEACLPLLKLLAEKSNPHVTIMVTPTSIELLSGEISVENINDFIKD